MYDVASFLDIVEVADDYLRKHPFDDLYMAGTANDITAKNKYTKPISYLWRKCEDLKTLVSSKKNLLDKIPNDPFWSRSRAKKCTTAQILLNRVRIKFVPFFKYVWFILDSTLNYNKHFSYLITTVQHKILY